MITIRTSWAIKSHLCRLFKKKQCSAMRAKYNHLSLS